jgi:hypothetical protein
MHLTRMCQLQLHEVLGDLLDRLPEGGVFPV